MSDRLGRRSGLPTFLQLAGRSDSEKLVTVEVRPGKVITGWSTYSSDTYLAPVRETHNNVILDVVGVVSDNDPSLVRVESLALCDSTPGSYYYDVDSFSSGALWDDGVTAWDGSTPLWDQVPVLYIHLTDGANPNDKSVLAEFGMFFSGRGEVHPQLGPQKLTDATLSVWTSATVLTGYTNETASGGSVNRDDSTLPSPSLAYAARCNVTGAGSKAFFYQPITGYVGGACYRVSGYYKGSLAKLRVSGGVGSYSHELLPDGRNVQAVATGFALDDTGTQWRRFCFDFMVPPSWTYFAAAFGAYDGTGDVWFGSISAKRIFRWNFYSPRLSSTSIPTVRMGANDIFFGGKPVGIGDISLSSGDGALDKALGRYDWVNRSVTVTSGFGWDSQSDSSTNVGPTTQPVDDRRIAFTGLIQSLDWSDTEVVFGLEDVRSLFNIDLPASVYDDISFGGMDLSYQGAGRPLLFGAKDGIVPIRISQDSSTLLGTYEIADCTKAPNGIKAISKVYSYADEDSATRAVAARRLELTATTDYSVDLDTGRFTLLRNVGIFEVTIENNQVSFNIGGVELTATLTVGLYTSATLATEIAAKMTTAAGTAISCSVGLTNRSFTISKAGGTLQLLCNTGASKVPLWDLIGFAKSADRTGALTYTGDEPVLVDVDEQHILRVNAQGYKDTAAGTYTGVANALIETGTDILRTLLIKWMGKSASIIDSVTFEASRDRAPESCCIYLNSLTSTRTIIETLEASNIGNFTVGGDGTVYYEVYVGTVPTGVVHLRDADFITFDMKQTVADVYGTVRVLHDQNPETGVFENRVATSDAVSVRFGRPDVRESQTYLKIADNALANAQRVLELTKSVKRVVSLSVKGQLLDHRPCNKIRITRNRALDSTGKISGSAFRIIALEHSFLTATTSVLAVDDVVTVAGIACISACQSLCESACQTSCESACQATCETACQTSCEVGCQESCQGGCQTSCEVACQTTCEVSCQTSCEVTCQTGCQVSCQVGCEGGSCQAACESACQTACESTCQTGCEVACQSSCQSSCQGACEATCQTGCQVACQTSCEAGVCQTGCQSSCQDACESTCQTGCEVTCQGGCQGACQTTSENPEIEV